MRIGVVAIAVLCCACGSASRPGLTNDATGGDDTPTCSAVCSADGKSLVCGDTVTDCAPTEFCDTDTNTCQNACAKATAEHSSIGCDYYATSMDVFRHGDCFAAFVANTYSAPAHLTVRHQGVSLPVAAFTKIPTGAGGTMSYADYDPVAGIAPGEVAAIFLAGHSAQPDPNAPTSDKLVLCPFDGATSLASFAGTGIGDSFEIETDVPVVSYQINPYGGGSAATTGASLLLPVSVWDTSYLAVNAFAEHTEAQPGVGTPKRTSFGPSMNIIASDDNTVVTILPTATVTGGNGIPAGSIGVPLQINLDKGQHAQITQALELTGSAITSNKPIGLMAGQPCMDVPTNQSSFCDHGEQMIPPVKAIGSSYAAVMYRARAANELNTVWRAVGVVDGTQLTYSTPVGGPTTLGKGQVVQFSTGTPFAVTSQDAAHPFMLFEYMTGSGAVSAAGLGDPDFVLDIPPDQYLDHYVFFTDPTYPETNLVVVQKRDALGGFADVMLDCAGAITGWQPIGSDFRFTRVDLSTGNFQSVGTCATGRREMSSTQPFGLWVWGWGSNFTTPTTRSVSYGYPGGMNVQPLNNVVL